MKKLYRPVGFKELELILDTGCRRFPRRLPTQDIFYPVLDQEYAIEIAKKWNTLDRYSNFSGYVTEFHVNEEYISKYKSHIVGKSRHKELWIPVEKLSEFNLQIVTPIRISHAFYGEQYIGKCDKIACDSYIEQFILLKKLQSYNPMDFSCTIQANWKIVTLNYIAWKNYDYSKCIEKSEKQSLLNGIKQILIRNQKWFFSF